MKKSHWLLLFVVGVFSLPILAAIVALALSIITPAYGDERPAPLYPNPLHCLHYGRDYRNPCNPPAPIIVVPPAPVIVYPPQSDQRPRPRQDLRDMHRNGIGGRGQ